MARAPKAALEAADPKAVAKFLAEAKKDGGRVIVQGAIHSWADAGVGHILRGDFVAIREGAKKASRPDMKPGFLLDIVNGESGDVETWGCPAILKYRLDQAQVEKGDSLKIMLVGQVSSNVAGQQPAWDFVLVHYPAARV